ncbi:unnamed protein product [Bursaphelenchus xylophilus]|nr:unnamed protein product [Bursaphelenchus xylophilus]CAG9112017.1 unnamed protein product [Bursaphelenchus xylophilus]
MGTPPRVDPTDPDYEPNLAVDDGSDTEVAQSSKSGLWGKKGSEDAPESPENNDIFSANTNAFSFLTNEMREQLGMLVKSLPKRNREDDDEVNPSPNKRTRRTVPLATKMEIIEAAKKKTFVAVGKDFDLAESTVRMIVKEKDKYIAANAMYQCSKRIRLTNAKCTQLDKALRIWVDGIRKEQPDYHFDNKSLQDKAREMASILGLKDFKASQGWLCKFKIRHGIAQEPKETPEKKMGWPANLSQLIKYDEERPQSSSSNHETNEDGAFNDLLQQILGNSSNNSNSQMYKLTDEESITLAARAANAMKNAYCPYSKFQVGSALLGEDGEVYEGVNVESASYPVGTCAERVAIGNAVTKGVRKFKGIAVATRVPDGGSPCGMCRQMLFEFGEYEVLLCNPEAKIIVRTSTTELLPRGFGPHHLKTQ